MSETVLDRIVARLKAALDYNANATVRPVALLWPDEALHWKSAIPRLREHLPIIELGPYEPESVQGPAYWVRCAVAGTVGVPMPAGTPIVYLPGVARGSLRAVDSCPQELAPIAELQYRSQWFSHPNGKDWTIRSLMTHPDRGLGLRIEEDPETTRVMLLAVTHLLQERMDRLARQLLDASFFSDLINPDPISTLLGWLGDPSGYPKRLDESRWSAFIQQCRSDYGFDPTAAGEITAARKLAERSGAWSLAWKRFAERPELYPGIQIRLRQAKPDQLFPEHRDAWPQVNEEGEDEVRSALLDFEALTPEGARRTITQLENEHAWRRGTVWAELDQAPLAFALEQLVLLGELSAQPLDERDLASLTRDYVERGWRIDDAVVRSLGAVQAGPNRQAVSAAAQVVYRPWLEAGARAFQTAVGPMANGGTYQAGPPATREPSTVTVFVDGLRLDAGQRVVEGLLSSGFEVSLSTSLAALPTVTETSRDALVPVRDGVLTAGPDLHSANAETGTKATIPVLRSLMVENAVQVLGSTDTGDPSGAAWAAAGDIDHRGHDVGIRLVDYLGEEVDRVVSRVRELVDAGWAKVNIVTDHGWMLLPGGMEKVELPVATTECKKGRCARLKDGASVEHPTVPWFWDRNVRIALAPGITCFEANKEYEHGGVSPQECIVPRIRVSRGRSTGATAVAEITKLKWLGLLCRVEVAGVGRGVIADIRALPGDPRTSIAEQATETSASGRVSLVIPDEDHEGERAYLVLVAGDGSILIQREVVVGRNR